MKIDKIKIKNFYCFVNTELDFSKYEGLTLIQGINKDNFVDMYKKVESGAKGMSKGVTNWFKGVMNHMGMALKTAGTSIQKYVKDYIDDPKIGLGIEIVKDIKKIKPSNIKNFTNVIKRDI